MRITTLAGFLALFGSNPLLGQDAGPTYGNLAIGLTSDGKTVEDRLVMIRPSIGPLLLGGAAGAGLAIAASLFVYQMNGGGRICGDDPCGMYAGLMTLVVLEPILIPVGVHLGNHRRGSLGGTLFASLVSGAAALYVGNWTDLGPGTLVLVPGVQIVASALIERASQREER